MMPSGGWRYSCGKALAAGMGGVQSLAGALDDQFADELGERGEDIADEPATALVAAAALACAALLASVTVVVGRTLFIGKAAQRQDGTAGQPTPPEADFIRSWTQSALSSA